MWKIAKVLACPAVPVLLVAQATAGLSGITGTVRDSSGAVMSGATVLVENPSKGIKRSLVSVALQVSSATQQVEVTSEVPLIDVDKRGVSQVVNQAQIDELPINGSRGVDTILLTPGVVNDGTFGLLSFRGIAGGNSFLTDGNDTRNQFYNENAGRTRISSQISQDAVQECQVLSAGYSAEYGRGRCSEHSYTVRH
jgi:hypothetical protein